MTNLMRRWLAVGVVQLAVVAPAFAQGPPASEKNTSVDFNLKGTLELVIKEQSAGSPALIEDVRDLARDPTLLAEVRDRYAKVSGFGLDFEAAFVVEYKGVRGRVIFVPIKGLRSLVYLVNLRGGSGDLHDLVFEFERSGPSTGSIYIGDFDELVATKDEQKARAMKITVDQKGQVKDAQLVNPAAKGFTCFFNTAKQYFDVAKAGALGVSVAACLFVAPTLAAAFAPCGVSVAQVVGYLYAARGCF